MTDTTILEVHDAALRAATVPTPQPGPGEVLIAVAAAGVNRADLMQVAGHYPSPPGAPAHPGLEVAGTIAAVGEGVTAWHDGDRVAALLAGGGYGTHVVAPVGQLLPIPEGLSDAEAAALPEALATVWSNLVGVGDRPVGGLRAGETVLVLGGAGGIGSIAVQVAAALGARVIATASTAKLDAVRDLGAAVVIDHRERTPGEVTADVREATDGRGVDVVLDVLGGGALAENVHRLASGGRLVVIGTQAGRRGELDLLELMQRRASVHGTTLRARPAAEKAAVVHDVVAHLLPHVAAGRIRPLVHATLPLARAEEAHQMLRDGVATGSVVLLP
ncbi:NADPH:quinone oxidoreductase [Serinibacter arcticus]|uniref:NADPH:quinone oxidoreductase n=1 Tax=Serinibacter arcticus TaxID=1655435 RepID=A0A2U1ZWX1_9MICO|nr:NAD(P)H-quinone oxidoreductase [Serinibacter arcticus]PWD51478.1 NADPH:quinone oxidoreductase [Serinibacter arcticus]